MVLRLTPRMLALLAAVALSAAAGCSGKPVPSDEALLRASFEQYKRAALRSDGSAVVPLLTRESLAYYDRLRSLALTGTQAQLDAARHIERMQVWMFRQLLTAEELSAMSREEVVGYVFDKHMMGEDLEESSAIDTLQIEGTVASARHVARGRPAGGPIREVTFRWEKGRNGQWSFDVLHTVALMELQLDDLHKLDPTKRKEELAQNIVQLFTNRELEPEHYAPMLGAANDPASSDPKGEDQLSGPRTVASTNGIFKDDKSDQGQE